MRKVLFALGATLLVTAALVAPAAGRDRPFSTATLTAMKLLPAPQQYDLPGLNGGKFSVRQIERFKCAGNELGADPAAGDAVDMSCNTTTYGQDYAPDNEIAIAVDPKDPDHLLAGSNDYYYRFNNATGARQAIVPTGFFTSFDGGQTWIDGQIPMGSGNGNGDPAPAFDAKHDVALMAQLGNVGGQGGPWVAAGNVSVSRSTDGGLTWSTPVVTFKGTGAGIGPAANAVFWDKEFIAVDNYEFLPGGVTPNPYFGRIYVTATKFVNGVQGSYARSPIAISYSDDGGLTWSAPMEISGFDASCSYQETGPANECDEDQFGYPAVAPNGDVYVHFQNYQNEAEWEDGDLFDSQVMVVKSTDGGATWSGPVQVVQLEDGYADMPFSVIRRQTIWGHQIRWTSAGNISISPVDPGDDGADIVVVFSDRGTANPNAFPGCFLTATGGLNIGTAPNYDPCGAGPGSDTNVYVVTSTDGGDTWSDRAILDDGGGAHQWFPWAGHKSDGTLVAAWDEDTAAAPADAFQHVLWVDGSGTEVLGPTENVDVSVTHWAGQYRPQLQWPAVCGPAGYPEGEGKDCNIFHGDYTGLAVGPDDTIHVVWTGLNRSVTSPQIDFYTGAPHDGYAQDAMYAQR